MGEDDYTDTSNEINGLLWVWLGNRGRAALDRTMDDLGVDRTDSLMRLAVGRALAATVLEAIAMDEVGRLVRGLGAEEVVVKRLRLALYQATQGRH